MFPIALDEGVTAPGVSVSLFALTVDGCDTSYDDRVLVVRAGDRIAAFVALSVVMGGGTENDGQITTTSVRDLVPGGLPEILLTVDTEYGDSDGEGCISYEERSTRAVVCTLEPTIACAQIMTARTVDESCDAECLAEGGERCGHDHHPAAGEHTRRPLAASLTFADGQAVVTVTADTEHMLSLGQAGTHDLATLIRVSPLGPL